ncbi:TIR domain-containing protein [Saccharothrix saharensis]|uniref:TIR domain-containing protein n=1 Tax=Saccharothrix saharensis TaxID=571190 RepID=A0A543JJE0_9PSEU|nr:toll/interleukin-1 receptor domain-containing protein [Saccharothrix saharensis]TQM82956.1 TIR domain-containing protein [Saccharothrix saharensis]
MTNARTNKHDVFVSYSRKDRSQVRQVVADLRASGLVVWLDEAEVGFGDHVRRKVFDGITASSVVLAFTSRNSLTSQFVLNELDAAMWREMDEKRVVVVPVLLGRIDHEELPQDLRGKNFVDLRHNFARRWEAERSRLIGDLTALVRGEATEGGAVVLRAGDPLIRFFARYHYRHTKDSRDPVPAARMVEVAQSFVSAIVSEWRDEDERLSRSGSEDRLFFNVQRFLNRYGEFALQQMTLYYFDHGPTNFAEPFTEEEFEDLADHLMVLMAVCTPRPADAPDDPRHVLVRLQGGVITLASVGQDDPSASDPWPSTGRDASAEDPRA